MWQLFAFLSAVFSALAAILEKKALFKTPPLAFSLILSLFTFVLAIPFLYTANLASLKIATILVLYIKSLLGAVAFLLVMNGIQKNELSKSLPLLVFTPAVVAVLAFLLLGENIGIWGTFGMVILLLGTYLLQLDKGKSMFSPFLFLKENKALWYIVGAILLFSVTSILDKTLLKSFKLPPNIFLPLQQLFFTINFLLIYLFKGKKLSHLRKITIDHWRIIFVIAVVAIVYRYTQILAVKSGSVAYVLSIKRTSVFFATVIGGTYFKEHSVLKRSIAVATMVVGIIIILWA